jgi:hypothetical protein
MSCNGTTTYAIDLILRPQHKESSRRPNHHLLNYRWWDMTNNTQYTGTLPIPLEDHVPLNFRIFDYTKQLISPTLKIEFKPLQGNQAHSPFDPAITDALAEGVASIGAPAQEPDYTLFTFAAQTVTSIGTDFEFSVDIDDASNPQDKWFVDPQMIVEGSGG